jgi:hypothetical protein
VPIEIISQSLLFSQERIERRLIGLPGKRWSHLRIISGKVSLR